FSSQHLAALGDLHSFPTRRSSDLNDNGYHLGFLKQYPSSPLGEWHWINEPTQQPGEKMTVSQTGPIFRAKQAIGVLGAALGTTLVSMPAMGQEGQVQEFDTIVVTASGYVIDNKKAPASLTDIT